MNSLSPEGAGGLEENRQNGETGNVGRAPVIQAPRIRRTCGDVEKFTHWISTMLESAGQGDSSSSNTSSFRTLNPSVSNDVGCWDVIELRVSGEEGDEMGLFAKTTIRTSDVVLRMPKQTMMITATVVADLPEYAALLQGERMEPLEVLTLFFYLERLWLAMKVSKGKCNDVSSALHQFFMRRELHPHHHKDFATRWEPYLRILPTHFSTPLEQFKLYLGGDKEETIATLAAQLPEPGPKLLRRQLAEFEQCQRKVSEVVGGQLSRRLFNWAWHVVNTRCFYAEGCTTTHPLVDTNRVEGSIAIVPLVDMINHAQDAQCVATFDKVSQSFRVVANRSIAAGEQLFLCYGPHDNVRLWLEYGFTLGEANIANNVPLTTECFLDIVSSLRQISPKHAALIRELDLLCTIYGSDEEPNYGLKSNCLILSLNEGDLWRWKKLLYHREEVDNAQESRGEEIAESEDDDIMEQLRMKSQGLLADLLNYLLRKLESLASGVENSFIRQLWAERIALVERVHNTTQRSHIGA